MGTRNLTMVVSNNQTKVAQYGQWDGYPSGQGVDALNIMSKIVWDNKLSEFKEKVDRLSWLTDEQIDDLNLQSDVLKKHPYLKRDWGAKILNAIMYGELVYDGIFGSEKYEFEILGLANREKFAQNSLFCEWGYVIDLDKNTFEVYRGCNIHPLPETDRFHYLDIAIEPQENDWYENNQTGEKYFYHAIQMIKSYDLNNLPTVDEFLKELEPQHDDDN